ncbi:MAG: acyltransferase [Lachnospiraceae bacterium]|nr:acyltransferase [Lachnospiraceae bacterium]
MNKQSLKKQKNGSVEFLRFLFTSIIIFFHINLDLWDQKKIIAVIRDIPVTFFNHGNIGVEFFFLVTGWLMAKSIYSRYIQTKTTSYAGGTGNMRSAGKTGNTGNEGIAGGNGSEDYEGGTVTGLFSETINFVTHKARAIFPYYLLACALTPLVRVMTDRMLTFSYFLNRLPSLFFLQRVGIGKPFIGCTWYLSSMLIALVVAYPLCRRFYKAYTLFIAPVLCAVLLGAIIVFTGSLGDIDDWFFFTYKTNIRAFAEISMGATAFEISRRMQGRVYPAAVRILLSLTALTCMSLSIAYMCSAMEGRLGIGVFYLLFVLVVIAFSGEGILCHAGCFSHPLFSYLGRISLPMYVTQTLLRRSVPWYFAGSSQWTQCVLIYLGIFGLAVFLDSASAFMHRHPVLQPLAKRQTQHT